MGVDQCSFHTFHVGTLFIDPGVDHFFFHIWAECPICVALLSLNHVLCLAKRDADERLMILEVLL